MATYKRGQKISENDLDSAISKHFDGLLDIKTDGHVILLSCIYAGMPKSLETGSDGKSLKHPGNGKYLNDFIAKCAGTFSKYVPRLKKFVHDMSPFDVEGDKIKFVEKRFRDMGGDRDTIFDRLCAYDKTWYDHTIEKKEKAEWDALKSVQRIIDKLEKMDSLSEMEKAILQGLLVVAQKAKPAA